MLIGHMVTRKCLLSILMVLVLFNMVAVLSTPSGSTSGTVVDKNELNVAKLVAAVSKLNKNNYQVVLWRSL